MPCRPRSPRCRPTWSTSPTTYLPEAAARSLVEDELHRSGGLQVPQQHGEVVAGAAGLDLVAFRIAGGGRRAGAVPGDRPRVDCGVFGCRITGTSTGSFWQSFDDQISSLPLVIRNSCSVDPAFIVHATVDVLVIFMLISGFSPALYTRLVGDRLQLDAGRHARVALFLRGGGRFRRRRAGARTGILDRRVAAARAR